MGKRCSKPRTHATLTQVARWRVQDLIERGLLAVGDGYRAKNEELASVGLPFARAGNINNGFHFDEADKFPEADLHKVREKISQPGDVVFTSKGTVGRFAFVQKTTPRFVFSPQLCYWRSLAPSEIDPRFLYYWMHGDEFYEQADAVKGQTDMAEYVSLSDQRRMWITLPTPPEQRTIARILGALDDKIEINRAMSATLEGTARALFKSWFVDFDPVAAKAANRQPFGMNAETAALFPAKFVDSELGPVPRGWRIGSVESVVEGVFDGPHATPPDATEGPVFLGIRNLTGTQIDLTETRHISEADWPRWTRRVTPRAGDIVFTYEATIGFFAIVPPDLRCCLGRRLALVRPKDTRTKHFLFHSFVAEPFQDLLTSRTTAGSTVDRTPLLEFPKYQIVWPDERILLRFESAAAPIWASIHQYNKENRILAVLRDALLPRLLSGELSLPCAADVAEKMAG